MRSRAGILRSRCSSMNGKCIVYVFSLAMPFDGGSEWNAPESPCVVMPSEVKYCSAPAAVRFLVSGCREAACAGSAAPGRSAAWPRR